MARKPEATFVSAVSKYLKGKVYHQSMYTPYSAGTPDHWYLGSKQSLWVEWKFYPKWPVRPFQAWKKLSPQQSKWIRRAKPVENVAVGLGCPDGGILCFNDELLADVVLLDRKSLAQFIESFVNEDSNGSADHHST